MGRQREDRAVWRWVGKDREWGKSKDSEAAIGLSDGEEACPKGYARGIVGRAAKSRGTKVSSRGAMKPGGS